MWTPRIKIVTDRVLIPGAEKDPSRLVSHLERYLKRGLPMGAQVESLVLRERDLTSEGYIRLARETRRICEEHGVDFYVHRRPDICRAMSFFQIHLSFRDFIELSSRDPQYEKACVSVHSVEEAKFVSDRVEGRSGKWSLMFGNVFETVCKPGLAGKGLEAVEKILLETRLPLYLIGGISWERIRTLEESGVYGFAMRSECMK